MTYTVHATWDPTGWWVVTVPDVPGAITQCRRLDQVPEDAAEVIEIQTGEAVDPSTLDIVARLEGSAGETAERARQLREESDLLRAQADEETRHAVELLRKEGFPLRDIGALTGISYQRVGQLLKAS